MGSTLHGADFSARPDQQAGLLRLGDLAAMNVENLAEVTESSGRSQCRDLGSRISVPVMRLVKWHMQPDEWMSAGWGTGRGGAPAPVGLAKFRAGLKAARTEGGKRSTH